MKEFAGSYSNTREWRTWEVSGFENYVFVLCGISNCHFLSAALQLSFFFLLLLLLVPWREWVKILEWHGQCELRGLAFAARCEVYLDSGL